MTDGHGWGQPPQDPSQGYGQRYPQDQPWRPGPYDPHAHLQRISGRQDMLRVPAWDQPGYGRPPSPPRPSRRRRRSRWPVYVGLGVLLFAAVAGITYVLTPRSGTAIALIARPETCGQQYAAWKTGPAGAGADKMIAEMRKAESAANAEDIPETDADLKAAGKDSAALRAYPMPSCADPSGYWPQILADIKTGGDKAGSASALGGMILAMAPLKKVQPLEAKLDAELKRTTAH
jgi:hypothetical protein